jgi:hypothetical protein
VWVNEKDPEAVGAPGSMNRTTSYSGVFNTGEGAVAAPFFVTDKKPEKPQKTAVS